MKKKIFATLLLVGSCSLFANTNLVGLYNFTDSGYLDVDLSGNFNNLTYYGNPVYTDGVVEFDGTDDYATTSINPVGSFSVSMWVKPASTANCDIMRSTTGPRGYAVVIVNGSFRAYVYGMEYSSLNSGIIAEVGKWYHISVVFEDNGLPPVSGVYEGTTKLYIDGNLTIEAPDFYQSVSTSVTYIGASTASSLFYSGAIKQLGIFEGVLFPSQVAMLASGAYSPIDIAAQNSNCITAELPYSYYPFTDPNDLAVSAKDFGTNKSNLTFYGDPVSVDNYLSFDGTNDYATAKINPVGSFSLSMWVKPASTAACDIIRSTTGPRGYAVVIANGSFRVYVYGMEYSVLNTGVMPQVGKWYHIAVVFEDNGVPPVGGIYEGTTRVYVDGSLKIEEPDYYLPVSSSVTYIGTSTSSSGFYNGSIDGLAVWNRVLTDDEISTLAFGTAQPLGLSKPLNVADFNADCDVNLLDFSVLADQWLNKALR